LKRRRIALRRKLVRAGDALTRCGGRVSPAWPSQSRSLAKTVCAGACHLRRTPV